MNHFKWIALWSALLVGLSACGGSSDAPKPTPGASNPAAASSPPGGPTTSSTGTLPAPGATPTSGASNPTANPVPLAADQPFTDPNSYSVAATDSLPATSVFDQAAVTHHTATINSATVNYTATTGHLSAIAPQNDPSQPADKEVSFFYVAYTLDNQPLGKRPVTFFWNGGPGSSTIWLHMGSWAPKTLDIDESSLTPAMLETEPASFPLIDNDVTMLSDSDLVFIDAPGTGYSEAIAPHTNQDFWSTDVDAAAFRDFILRYDQVNNRQTSPKYLYGESYGGIRTPIVADLLEQAGSPGQGGPALTGVILNSPILSYKSNCYESGLGNVPCDGFIPTYAAVAYSGNQPVANPGQLSLSDYAKGAVLFTAQTYAPANQAYMATASVAPDAAVLNALAGWTAVSAADWGYLNTPPYYFVFYLWPQAGSTDMYNGLVTAPADATYDASSYNDLAFTSAINSFLPGFLGYTSASAYAIEPLEQDGSWSYTHGTDTSGSPTSLPDLVDVLTLDPALKVQVFGGYYDLVCPFYQTELDLQGAGLSQLVPFDAFPGGHMIYLTKSSRAPMKQAIDTFYSQPATAAR
jgi:carboxypeptidase C (cathepsin A)